MVKAQIGITMRRRNANILRAISRLAHVEHEFLQQEFLAPVVRRRNVSVRIAGVVCSMAIDPPGFSGWGIFLPITPRQAMLDRPATMAQRRMYLELFPRVRLIVAQKEGKHVLCVPANPVELATQAEGKLRVELVDDVESFDHVVARFDGRTFWFDRLDESVDPRLAAHLRRSLIELVEPKAIDRPGLTLGQRWAYALAYAARLKELPAYCNENRLRDALAHAGAVLRDFAQQGDVFRVSYDLDGERHVSTVNQNDLTVQSSGICLAGRDRDFDLASLVSVLREGREQW
jgi:hypothetical protein